MSLALVFAQSVCLTCQSACCQFCLLVSFVCSVSSVWSDQSEWLSLFRLLGPSVLCVCFARASGLFCLIGLLSLYARELVCSAWSVWSVPLVGIFGIVAVGCVSLLGSVFWHWGRRRLKEISGVSWALYCGCILMVMFMIPVYGPGI